MEAEIIEEDDEWVGVRVTDNHGNNHKIAVRFDGEIQGHSQDGYPDDASKREAWEARNVTEARNYARYVVAREHGYDTIPVEENPARINAVRHALASLSTDEFQDLFGEYYRQHLSNYRDSIARPVALPSDIPADTYVQYELGVYLRIDDDYLDEHASELDAFLENAARDQDPGALEHLANVFSDDTTQARITGETLERVQNQAAEADVDLTGLVDIDTVSGIHIMWEEEVGLTNKRIEERRQMGDVPYDRTPDALLQLPAIDVEPEEEPEMVTEFQEFLCYHLRCQVRDCFVGMGIDPPYEFQVVGPGIYDYTVRYKQLEIYPDFHDLHPEAVDFEQWHDDGLIEPEA